MKVLGVTGGIGSGKSTVCRLLEDRGAVVFNADEVGRRILQEDPAARRELVGAFGERAYDAEGRLDRAWVASRVFGDREAVERIEAIVHPRVRERFEEARTEARARGVRVLVYESALLVGSQGRRGIDRLVVVTAPEEVRIRRVTGRDGSDPEDVRRRVEHQASDEEFREAADIVIENAGTPDELEAQVDALWRRLVESGGTWPVVPDEMPRRGNLFTRTFGRIGLRLMRFRIVADLPPLERFVMIGAPHTTNWDFVVAQLALLALGLRIHWIGKHTIFRRPFGGLMRLLGGIPVDRTNPGDVIDQVVHRFGESERFAVGLSPEGTRRKTDRWKSGFYRIAVAADVPILLVVLDYARREIRFEGVVHPTGDYGADLACIRSVYRPGQAKYPEKF